MTFNQRLMLCWMVTVCFAVAAFFHAISPPQQGGLLQAVCAAVFVIVHGLTWYQLVVLTQKEPTKTDFEGKCVGPSSLL